MTTEEAIKVLNELDEITLYKKEAEALEKGIEAIQRTIPKEVLYSYDGYFNGEPVVDMASCPNCVCDFEQGDETWKSNFCPNCGQALKWEVAESKEEEKNDNTDGDS